MASAAAVGADSARSPMENNLGEDEGLPGEITSGTIPKDDEEDDDDDDLPANSLSKRSTTRRVNGNMDDEDEEDGMDDDDLFGADDGEAGGEIEEPK
jgi:hypothetical protein